MQCTTGGRNGYRSRSWGTLIQIVVVLSLVLLALGGVVLESLGGWLSCAPRVVIGIAPRCRPARVRATGWGLAWGVGWRWLGRSWVLPALRSEVMLSLVWLNRVPGWAWLGLLPWLAWLWQGLGLVWPRLGRQPAYRWLGGVWARASGGALIGLGLVWLTGQSSLVGVGGSESEVLVEEDAEGVYHVRLRGEFELQVNGQVPFYQRLLVIFLGLLTVPGAVRGSRRTRDGRTPFVRQEQLAAWFGVPHPVISRWYGYWLRQDWRRLLSQRWGEVLTLEQQQRVIESWVQFPWWSAAQVWEHLHGQGSRLTLAQVQEVGRASGWQTLRQALGRQYHIRPEAFRPRDAWLVEQLLAQVQQLVTQLEAAGGLPAEQRVAIADLTAHCAELELQPAAAAQPLPWLLQVEHRLFGQWEAVTDGSVRCLHCGSGEVSRKSRQARPKRYVDAQGQPQTVAVYRYYCHNLACPYRTFTNLPPDLLPYTPWTLQHHLAALQHYEWAHSVYRCTSQLLGVSKLTAYRWVSAFGYQLLPVAALFGVVRSSGVVGVDEKYVLVPKNDKPEADMQRWMYVYFAVDCYTYDLLHIAIYPYNTKQSATAFLLAVRHKGYQPNVIVTDLRVDYTDVVAQSLP